MKCAFLSVVFLAIFPVNSAVAHSFLPSPNHKTVSNITPTRTLAKNPVVKLYPKVRTETENEKTSLIPINLIKSFMEHSSIVDHDTIKNAPYIITDAKNTYLYSTGDRIYANKLTEDGKYIIYKVGQDIRDPESGKLLGKEIIYSAEAKTIGPKNSERILVRDELSEQWLPENERYSGTRIFKKKAPPFVKLPTQIAKPLIITKAISEVSAGDRLLLVPEDSNERFNFIPHAVAPDFQAQIIHVFEGVSGQHIGKYQNILLNKGSMQGLDKGAVVSIYAKLPNKSWTDTSNVDKLKTKHTAFPANLVGKAMVYNVFDNLAYAIVIENYDNAYIQAGNVATGSGKDLEDIPEYEPKP